MERELWQRPQLIKLHVSPFVPGLPAGLISQLPCSQVWRVESDGL